jgi:hypothetical protein
MTIANNSWHLSDHLTNAPSTNAICSSHFNTVVLQEQSDVPSVPSQRDSDFIPAAASLYRLITNHSASAMFYETWGHLNGDTANHCGSYDIPAQYKTCDGGFGSFTAMNVATREGYALAANDFSEAISPIGLAWARVRNERPDLDLYILDDSYGDRHPNSYGAYLAACVFYASLFGRSPEGCTYFSTNTIADAQYLQSVAASVVLDNPFAMDAYGFAANRYPWASDWQQFTNSSGAPAGTVIVSGGYASASPSLLVNSNVSAVSNLWLGLRDPAGSRPGQGRLYVITNGVLVVTNSFIAGQDGKGFLSQMGGSLSVPGTLTLGANAGSFGSCVLSNGALTASQIVPGLGSNSFRMYGGTLSFSQFGAPSRPMTLDCEGGAIALTNSPTSSTIFGNFTNTASSVLSIQLASTNVALVVSGTASLKGSLRVDISPNLTVTAGRQITLISAASIAGTFTKVMLPAHNPQGLEFTVAFDSNSVTMAATRQPLPVLHVDGGVNQISVYWPTSFTGFALESAISLSTPVWSPIITNGPVLGTNYTVVLGTTNEAKFYRLRK